MFFFEFWRQNDCILRYSDVIPVIPVIPVFPIFHSHRYGLRC